MLPPGLPLLKTTSRFTGMLSALLPPSNGLRSGSVDVPSQNSVLSRRLPPLLRAANTALDDLEEEEEEEEQKEERRTIRGGCVICV